MTTSPDPTIESPAEPTIRPDVPDARPVADATVIAELRRELLVERERSLNATDRVLGAQAEAAQARAEIKELEYRLHVREAELAEAAELLAGHQEPGRPLVGRMARLLADRAGTTLRQLASRARSR